MSKDLEPVTVGNYSVTSTVMQAPTPDHIDMYFHDGLYNKIAARVMLKRIGVFTDDKYYAIMYPGSGGVFMVELLSATTDAMALKHAAIVSNGFNVPILAVNTFHCLSASQHDQVIQWLPATWSGPVMLSFESDESAYNVDIIH